MGETASGMEVAMEKIGRAGIGGFLVGAFLWGAVSARAGDPAGAGAPARMAPCPERPNCVSSLAPPGHPRHVAPIETSAPGPEDWQRLRNAVLEMGGEILEEDGEYLRAIFRSRLFGFVDDLELFLDDGKGRIEVRSASRQGFWDLGVNRRRVERLRRRVAGPG